MKFRVTRLKDGNGKIIYRPEIKDGFWSFFWPCYPEKFPFDTHPAPIEFDTQEEVDKWVCKTKEKFAEQQRAQMRVRA